MWLLQSDWFWQHSSRCRKKLANCPRLYFSLTLLLCSTLQEKYGLARETRVGHGTFTIVFKKYINCLQTYMYECKSLFLQFSLQKLPEDATPQKTKTGSAKQCEKKLKNEPSSVTAETLWGILLKPEQQSSCVYWRQWQGRRWERTFQKLPRHMRWRAMSHNVRQLPRRLMEN